MSTIDKQFDITPQSGMDTRGLAKDAEGRKIRGADFIQNVVPRPQEFTVRPGFGLVRQYGTTLSAGRVEIPANSIEMGLGKCIGATHVRTVWQTDQILAIHPLFSFTGNFRDTDANVDLYGRRAYYLTGLVAHVHDLHTGRHVEVVLHEQDTTTDDLSQVFPNYATRFDTDRSRWLRPSREPAWAIFAPMQSGQVGVDQFNVVVTIDGVGQWTYRPVDTSRVADRCNDSLDRAVLFPLMGEQAMFSPLALANGLGSAAEGFTYLVPGELGAVTAQCAYNGDRMVYGSTNTLWFSDPFLPQSILADNKFVLPAPDAITCMASVRSLLFVATVGARSWVYQPSLTGNQDTGVLTVISQSEGCVGPRAYCTGMEGVFFASDNGVRYYSGGVGLEWLSEPIDRLWTDPQSLQLPLTDFYTKTGVTTLATVQLPARLDVRAQMQNARLCWDDERNTLHCVCDDLVLSWTRGFGWSVWLFQTHAGSIVRVQGASNIEFPTLIPVRDALYLLGGPDSQLYREAPYDSEIADSVTDKSCYLLRMGRGGALDRSMSAEPAKFDAWVFTLAGYVVAGDIVRITIGGGNHDYTVLDGDTFQAIYRGVGTAVASASYTAVWWEEGVAVIRNTAGAPTLAVTSTLVPLVTVGAGTFTAVNVQVGVIPDVSEADLEDERTPVGGYVKFPLVGAPGAGAFFVGAPIVVPIGYQWPDGFALGVPVPSAAEAVQTYWFPVRLAGNLTPGAYSFRFNFDNVRWQPICCTATTPGEMGFVVPDERLASDQFGYSRGAMTPTRQVRVFLAGVANPNGDEIRIDFDGTGGAWTHQPNLNLGIVGPDTLLYLGFRYIGENPVTAGFPLTALWLDPTILTASAGAVPPAAQFNLDTYFWQEGRYPTEQAALAAKQQPVDWAVKTRQVEDGGNQVRCLGVFVDVMSHGDSSDNAVPVWRYGPVNTATSTDWRDYSAQALDFNSLPPGNSEANNIGVYPRLQPATTTADPVANTFNNQGRWGSSTDGTQGNVLVGDAAVDTLATTDGSQGVRVSLMVHGTMNSPGESVRLGAIKAVLQRMGLARRWR